MTADLKTINITLKVPSGVGCDKVSAEVYRPTSQLRCALIDVLSYYYVNTFRLKLPKTIICDNIKCLQTWQILFSPPGKIV